MISLTIDKITYKISFSHRHPKNSARPGTSCRIKLYRGDEEIYNRQVDLNLSKKDTFNFDVGRKYALAEVLAVVAGGYQVREYFNDSVRRAIWKAYLSRRKQNPRKLIQALKPKDPYYVAKLSLLSKQVIGQPCTIPHYIVEYAENSGIKVTPLDDLFWNAHP